MTREEAIETLQGKRWLCCIEKWKEALDVAIETMKSYDIERQKEYNEGFNACFDSLIPNQEKMYERGKADVLKIIEDIRAEIEESIKMIHLGDEYDGLRLALKIINKHIKGVSECE